MRVSALTASLTASLLLGAAFISTLGLLTPLARADETCACPCPNNHIAMPRHAETHPMPRQRAQTGAYSYRSQPIYQREGRGVWRMAPAGYVEPEGLAIDQGGWTGGVGYGQEGGGGYGQLLLTGANSQNGPTYNSLGESFQQNPSMAHPFQNRSMGGIAPSTSATK